MSRLQSRRLFYGASLVGVLGVVALGLTLSNRGSQPSAGEAGAVSSSTPAEVAFRGGNAPHTPPALICGQTSELTGPKVEPKGAVRVPAGDDSHMNLGLDREYWWAPGVHTIGRQPVDQIVPATGSRYIGAPGAIISGQGINGGLFEQHASHVTIEYLTIEDFVPSTNEGVVNHDSADDWTIEHDTIRNNRGGAAVMLGSGDVLRYDCLAHNGQLGFNSYSANGVRNIVVDHDEISYNGSFSQNAGCGCDGGGKFFFTRGARFTYNYVHNNAAAGLWGDTNNVGVLISHNYISNNASPGIIYEISYNANIIDNRLVNNSWRQGPTSEDFPDGAIYISNSGGDGRLDGGLYSHFRVEGNDFINNWGGVIEWEDSNRYCGSSDSASDVCTLVDPSVAGLKNHGKVCGLSSGCADITSDSCRNPKPGTPAYWDCRWRTKNIDVSDNRFFLNPALIPKCKAGTQGNRLGSQCGYSGIFAQYGNAPYAGDVIENAIAFHQNNVFAYNTYVGPWSFEAPEQNASDTRTFAQWRASPFRQDRSSVIMPD